METTISGITAVNKTKQARVDSVSVNSILVDCNRAAENNRWLVADTVALSADTGNLILR